MGTEQTESQRSRVSKAFDLIDLDGSGELSLADIESLAERLAGRFGFAAGSPQHESFREVSTELWQGLQGDLGLSAGDKVSRKEYVDYYASAEPAAVQHILAPFAEQLFTLFDTDGDGKVSKSEFERYHRAWGVSQDRIEGTFEQLDTDGSGDLSKDELHAYLSGFIFGDSR
ncbi:EF-hand domain-containing protein [Streptomyces sp. NPDC051132]|uniref:EF-hand domain-containing protein n=1 Tax=unclassified Streptomyces TaxID=2593676 RepID=UPI003434EDCF